MGKVSWVNSLAGEASQQHHRNLSFRQWHPNGLSHAGLHSRTLITKPPNHHHPSTPALMHFFTHSHFSRYMSGALLVLTRPFRYFCEAFSALVPPSNGLRELNTSKQEKLSLVGPPEPAGGGTLSQGCHGTSRGWLGLAKSTRSERGRRP